MFLLIMLQKMLWVMVVNSLPFPLRKVLSMAGLSSLLSGMGLGNMDLEPLIMKYGPDILIAAMNKDKKLRDFVEYIIRDEIRKIKSEITD